MKGRFVVTALFFSILAACSKDYGQNNSSQKTFITPYVERQPQAFISGWETIPSWKAETKNSVTIFSYTRILSGLKNDDVVVLVFARNLWGSHSADSDKDEKPLMMPFYFLPYFEKPNYTEEWKYTVSENRINISLVLKETADVKLPGKKVQLQFFVIQRQMISEKKLSPESIHKLSYGELIQTFGSSALVHH